MAIKLLLLSAGSKPRLVRSFLFEFGELNADVEVHILDSNPNLSFPDSRVKFHHANSNTWNSSNSLRSAIESISPDIILPTRTAELIPISKISDSFRDLTDKIVVSDVSFLRNSIDKLSLSNSGKFDNQMFIETFDSPERIDSELVVIKERFGAGSKGLVICPTKDINQSILTSFSCPVFQNFIYGAEFSVDVYFTKKSSLHALSLRYRDQVQNGEAIESTFFSNRHLELAVVELLREFPLRGPVNIQGFLKPNGDFCFFDLNPRIGGSYFMSRFNGFRLSEWIIQEYFDLCSPSPYVSKRFAGTVIRTEMGYEAK